jgi:DNA-binding GntR family transcriptional regulator
VTDLSSIDLTGHVKPRNAADYVVDSVRDAILSGDLDDGAVLSQSAIATHLGVSRAPVREAFRQLATEGLIEMRAHHVAIVRAFGLDRLRELFQHRALLEGYLIERATPLVTRSLLEELQAMTAAMRDIVSRDEWLTLDGRFHELLTAQAGDATGLELVTLLRARAERCVRTWGGRGTVFRPDEALPEHVEILTRVSRRDGAGAGQAMMRHIQRRGACLIAHGRAIAEAR